MTKKIYIKGMTCDHCVRRVENSLKAIEGVSFVKVDLQGKVATVELIDFSPPWKGTRILDSSF